MKRRRFFFRSTVVVLGGLVLEKLMPSFLRKSIARKQSDKHVVVRINPMAVPRKEKGS